MFEAELSAGERGAGVEAIFSPTRAPAARPAPIEVSHCPTLPTPADYASERTSERRAAVAGRDLVLISACGPLVVTRLGPSDANEASQRGSGALQTSPWILSVRTRRKSRSEARSNQIAVKDERPSPDFEI